MMSATLAGVPDYMAGVTVGQILFFLGGCATIVTVLALVFRKPLKGIREVYLSMRDLGGHPERRDAAGNVVEEAQPSLRAEVRALHATDAATTATLKEVRDQVSNTHTTNFRDDLDLVHRDVVGLRDDLANQVRTIRADYGANHAEGMAANKATLAKLEEHIAQHEGDN